MDWEKVVSEGQLDNENTYTSISKWLFLFNSNNLIEIKLFCVKKKLTKSIKIGFELI